MIELTMDELEVGLTSRLPPPPAILPSSPNIDMPQLPSTRFLPPTKTTPDGATRGNRLQM